MNSVNLNEIISVMNIQNEDVLSVVDKWDSAVITYDKNVITDDIYEKIDNGTYITLPSSYEIDNESIINDFLVLNNLKMNTKNSDFKDLVKRNNLNEKWFEFKNDRYKEIAIDWLENNKLKYTK
jgi:hypothetical protein